MSGSTPHSGPEPFHNELLYGVHETVMCPYKAVTSAFDISVVLTVLVMSLLDMSLL